MSFFRILETDELVEYTPELGEMIEIFAESSEDAFHSRDDIVAMDEKGFFGGSLVVIVQDNH